MTVTRELVLKLESLARARLTEAEREAALPALQEGVDLFDRLRALDTSGAEPLAQPVSLVNVAREDVVVPSMDNELLLANAAREKDGAFCVYRAVE